MKGLKHKCYEKQLRELELFSLKESWLYHISARKYLAKLIWERRGNKAVVETGHYWQWVICNSLGPKEPPFGANFHKMGWVYSACKESLSSCNFQLLSSPFKLITKSLNKQEIPASLKDRRLLFCLVSSAPSPEIAPLLSFLAFLFPGESHCDK